MQGQRPLSRRRHYWPWVVLGLVFFPLLGPDVPLVNRLPFSLVGYTFLGCSLALPLALARARVSQLDWPIRWWFVYGLGILLVCAIKFALFGQLARELPQLAVRYILPFELALLLLLAYSRALAERQHEAFLEQALQALLVFGALQFLVSMPEARGAEINIRRVGMDALEQAEVLGARDLLTVEGGQSLLGRLGFVRPMTGGFLWFNEYGVMLALMAAAMAIGVPERKGFAWALPALLFAVVASTTKTAVVAVAMTIVIYVAVRFVRNWLLVSVMLVCAALAALVAFEYVMFDRAGASSMQWRFVRWNDGWWLIRDQLFTSWRELFLGASIERIVQSRDNMNLLWGSVENEWLYLFIYYGPFGVLCFLIGILSGTLSALLRLGPTWRGLALIPLLVIFACSALMDCLNKYFALPLVVLLFLQLDAWSRRGKSDAPQSANVGPSPLAPSGTDDRRRMAQ